MAEFVEIGDLHLDGLSSLFPGKDLPLQMKEVEKAFVYARENGIKHVVFMGDIAENYILSGAATDAFIKLLCKYDDIFEIHIILGNHDVADIRRNSLAAFKTLVDNKRLRINIYTEPTQKKIDGVVVNFLPFPAEKAIESKVQTLNFAHLERPGSLRDNGTPSTSGPKISDTNHWIIGHLHQRQQMTNNWWVGTLYQKNFGENGPWGFTHSRHKLKGGKLKTQVTYVDTSPGFRLINLDIKEYTDLQQISNFPNFKYKLWVAEGIKISKKFLMEHPNVEYTFRGSRKKIKKVKSMSFSPTYQLEDFLKEEGASKKEVSRGVNIVNKILSKLTKTNESSVGKE